MEGGPCPLLASAPASASTKRVPPCLGTSAQGARPRPWPLRECGSRGCVLQGPGVGVLAGLHKIVQVEVACDERGGLAVRLVQGQRLIPLKVAHHLLKARALVEAVRPKRLHLLLRNFARRPFHAPALGARVAQLGYLAVHGLRQPAHVVQVPLPLLRLPAFPKPVVEGPRLLQFSVALQQQRLASCNWGTSCGTTGASAARCGIMLLYQYACACGQPVISGLPLQHAQRALLLSCELRRLRFCRCLRRCLNRCLSRCLWCLNRGRLWLALWSSRLSRHVLLRFVLAPRGPRRFGSCAASGAACGASCASSCASGALSCSVGSI